MKSMLGATFSNDRPSMYGHQADLCYRPNAATNFLKIILPGCGVPGGRRWIGTGRYDGTASHTKGQIARRGLLEDAVRRGADVRDLGRIDNEATYAGGYFMRPVVVTDLPDDAPLMAEEWFCPAIPVATYDELDDAIARANRSIYGLSGSVWSRDVERALGVARKIEAGQVWINSHGVHAINHLAPYGGVKQSGIGRKSGIEGVREYLQSRTITTHETS